MASSQLWLAGAAWLISTEAGPQEGLASRRGRRDAERVGRKWFGSAICGPIGGGVAVPTRATHSRTPGYTLEGRGGRLPNPDMGKGSNRTRRTVWRAPFGVDDRADAPSATKNEIRTDATLFPSERAARSPPVDLGMAPSVLIYPKYGGTTPSWVVTD